MTKTFSFDVRCAVISDVAPGSTNTFVCHGMEGRYINIVAPGRRSLTLCEVKVFGQPGGKPDPKGNLNQIVLSAKSFTLINKAWRAMELKSV